MRRVDEVIVQVVFREYDDISGLPVGEIVSQPAKVYRASAQDFWDQIDKFAAEVNKAADAAKEKVN